MNAQLVAGNSLPLHLTRFVGREREISELRELIERTRLLTLTGAGGSGKTRLAREVAVRIAEQDGGELAWVELAPLAGAELLPQQVAVALGVREDSPRSATDSIIEAIRDRRLLIVLDNCEHLIEACAQLADRLLRNCRELRLLATSREALSVTGERAWLVPPLSLPATGGNLGPEQLAEYEAIQLFIDRAAEVLPSFRLEPNNTAAVVQICRRLDGIPLAIELAAARVRVLAPEQIAARLDDAFRLLTSGSRTAIPRHQTLRATVDWSYRLLGVREQLLLRRLSAFAGSFNLDAAEAVCAGDGIDPADVLDLLAGLADRSLLVIRHVDGRARYALLEIVRQYAREMSLADPADDAATRRRHAGYHAELAEYARPYIERTAGRDWNDRLRSEQDNLRAALHWTLNAGNDPDLALTLVSALWRFWFHANLWKEGRSWCEAMIAASADRKPADRWIRTLTGAGVFAYLTRDSSQSRLRLEEAERMSRALGDRKLLALVCYRLAHLYCDLGEDAAALERAEEGVRLAREHGEAAVTAEVLVYGLAFVRRMRGEVQQADEAFAEAARLAREGESWMSLTEAAMGRALIALERLEVQAAAEYAKDAFEAARRFGDDWYLSRALVLTAAAALESGDPAQATRLLGCGAALRDAAGTQVFPHEQAFYNRLADRLRNALRADEFVRCWTEGASLTVEEVDRILADIHPAGRVEGAPDPAGHIDDHASGFLDPNGAGSQPAPVSPQIRSAQAARPPQTEVEPALRVTTLGRTEIRMHGQLLPADAWVYARPKELFLYLLTAPRGRTREQAGVVFWPDSTSAQVKNAFHVALHHLRKVLGGTEWVVLEGDRYRINPGLTVEFDVAIFEERVTAAIRSAEAGQDTIDALRSALALYGGEFLAEESAGDWHLEIRDRSRRLFEDGLSRLGDLLMRRERYAEAVPVYERLLATNDLDEDAHRRLMICHSRTGRRGHAIQQYERLVELLSTELETVPDPETRVLYEQIRGAPAV